MNPLVSIIIPTFKRAPFLKYALEALSEQSYRNFEIVVIVKPGGDETLEVLKDYPNLPIKIVMQKEGFVSEAYNLGLREAKGEVIVIMDDDSVPYSDWLEKYVKIYVENEEVGGVSGDPLNAEISEDGEIKEVPEVFHLLERWHNYYYGSLSYNRPLNKMSDFMIFIGKDGLVHTRPALKRLKQVVPSLLFMGANMSVRKEAIEGLKIDENLVLGFSYEQILAYQIWRRGYKLLYDPNVKVLHVVHSESLGRFFHTPSRAAHRDAEYILSFFILKPTESEISRSIFVVELASLVISRALQARTYGLTIALARIYGLLYGLTVGCAYSISNAFRGRFSIKNALRKFA
jgi:glycosyltransferase involved in cell wall biosynthesis